MTSDEIKEVLTDHAEWLENPLKGKRAILQGADLQNAILWGANLQGAVLQGADLRLANLQRADLQNAILRDAILRGAILRGANLQRADLQRAILQGVNLQGVNLEGANLPEFQLCPEGSFVAWKKVEGAVLKLEVPSDALRTSSLVGRKCRASKVKVLEAFGSDKGQWESLYEVKVVYKVGEVVIPDSYDPDIRVECSHGIHFFLTREEAENYNG